MRQMHMQSKIVDRVISILDRLINVRSKMIFDIF